MVVLEVKRADQSYFLLDCPNETEIDSLIESACEMYNGILKIQRLCAEIEDLAQHGVSLPPEMQASQEVIPAEECCIWFSGKELLRGRKLVDYAGRNEKCKLIVKLTKRGQGPPGREPVVSETDQRAMMAYYYRRQEEAKKLEANEDDSYLGSAWAEPGQLKRQFHGLNNIRWS